MFRLIRRFGKACGRSHSPILARDSSGRFAGQLSLNSFLSFRRVQYLSGPPKHVRIVCLFAQFNCAMPNHSADCLCVFVFAHQLIPYENLSNVCDSLYISIDTINKLHRVWSTAWQRRLVPFNRCRMSHIRREWMVALIDLWAKHSIKLTAWHEDCWPMLSQTNGRLCFSLTTLWRMPRLTNNK